MRHLDLTSMSEQLLAVLADVSVESAALAAIAAIGLRLSGRCTMSLRHRVWLTVLVAMLALPVIGRALPGLAIPVFSIAPSPATPVPAEPSESLPSPSLAPVDSAGVGSGAGRGGLRIPWTLLLAGCYVAGVAGFGIWLAVGLLSSRRALRGRTRIDCGRLGGGVPVFDAPGVIVPVVVGAIRPAILLPREWSSWPEAKLRSVLAHERAHVARRDYAVLLLALVNRCVFWFHPVAWLLPGRLSDAAELACDDVAVREGSKPREYARHLLEIVEARGSRPGKFADLGPSMASRSQLARRVDAILEWDDKPAATRSGVRARAVAAAVFALAVGAACVRLAVSVAADVPADLAGSAGEPVATFDDEPRSASASPSRVVQASRSDRAVDADRARPSASRVEAPGTPPPAGGSEVDGLEGLTSPDPKLRARAIEAIIRTGDRRLVARLVELLGDEDAIVRMFAAKALGRLGDRRAVAPLIRSLEDENAIVRQEAAESLGRLGARAEALVPLVGTLRDETAIVRMQAARALGRLGDERAAAPLIAALKDEDDIVRQLAAESLGDLRARLAVEPLIGVLSDTNPHVRQAAAGALGSIGDERAVDALVARSTDANSFVRDESSRALDRISRGR
jgi:beta-lactamase regulating signal transducer with metallopeptidase domain